MAVRAFENKKPIIANTAWIDETAVVIGDVEIGDESSIWPGVVIRGDIHSIRIGDRSNVQDNSIIHVTHAGPFHPEGFRTIIGDDATVGHGAILHGCTLHNHCLIGMGSIVMDGAVIEEDVLLGSGSIVGPGKILESGFLWVGAPARKIRKLKASELEFIRYSANYYSQLKNRHQGE